ncbi:hypothetical protein AAG906_027125 [Vitis piasezkii]
MHETLFSHDHLRSYVFHFPPNALPPTEPVSLHHDPPCPSLNPLLSKFSHTHFLHLSHPLQELLSPSNHRQTITAPPPKPPPLPSPPPTHFPLSSHSKWLRLLLQCTKCVVMDNLDDASDPLPEIPRRLPLFETSLERVATYFADVLQVCITSSCLDTHTPLVGFHGSSHQPMTIC